MEPRPGTAFPLEVTPRLPAGARAPRRARRQPVVQLGPADAHAVLAPAPACGMRSATTPRRSCGRGPARLDGSGRRPGVPAQLQPRAVGLRHLSRRATAPRTVEWLRPTAIWSRTSARSSASTRACRSTRAGSASSPATTARPRATCALPFIARGPALPPGLLLADDRHRGQPARATTRDSEFDDLPVTPVRRGDGTEVRGRRRAAGRRVTCKVWQRALRARDALPARHGPGRERRAATATSRTSSTAATAAPASSRRSCWAWAACARSRPGAQAHRLAHQRRPRRIPDAGAHARAGASRAWTSPRRSRPSRPTRSSPRTRRCRPATTTSRAEMIWRYFAGFCQELELARDDFLALGRAPTAAATST